MRMNSRKRSYKSRIALDIVERYNAVSNCYNQIVDTHAKMSRQLDQAFEVLSLHNPGIEKSFANLQNQSDRTIDIRMHYWEYKRLAKKYDRLLKKHADLVESLVYSLSVWQWSKPEDEAFKGRVDHKVTTTVAQANALFGHLVKHSKPIS